MYSIKDLPFALFVFLLSWRLIAAVPTWEGMNGRGSIGSLIPGASYIEAMGALSAKTNHLAPLTPPGPAANLTIRTNMENPPTFYINQNQLWLLVNETTVYPVNVHNSTTVHQLPMQLILGHKRDGITDGTWRWKATQLYYEFPGGNTNHGLYYRCILPSGSYNVFMTVIDMAPPPGCQIITLHSFIRGQMKLPSA
ncbi:hypothetical protein D9613_005084 [Agrocybe pediades]|uniref:Uncharacterized protein n=1 Tax=Agrocybe pediades TaxID=84607 RepID=A0A8H4VSX8_9AGAR|nr:hypothetical protein D9613_005084 [Agrocybe pediades]